MENAKDLILDRARARFDRFGFQKTTMDEISRDCGMSKRTLYGHFRDKRHLFESLIEREGRQDLERILNSTGEVPDPLDRLLQLLRTAIAYFSGDTFLTRLLRNDDALFSSLMNGKTQLMITEHLLKMLEGIIAEGQAQGRIRPEVDGSVAAYIGFRLFQAFSYMRTIPFDPEKERTGAYTDALVDFFHNALVRR